MEDTLLQRLIGHFSKLVEKYTISNENAVCCDIKKIYKNELRKKGLMFVSGNVHFKGFTFKCVYIINGGPMGGRSELECRFAFDEAPEKLEYSFYDILNVIDQQDFKSYSFPYILSEKEMSAAFKYLCDGFDRYYEKICTLSLDKVKRRPLLSNLLNDINEYYGQNIFESKSKGTENVSLAFKISWFCNVVYSRFCSDAYLNYLEGDYKRAIKKYSRIKHLTLYEKRLLAFMKDNIGSACRAIDDELNSMKKARTVRKSRGEPLAIIIGTLLLLPAFGALYIALYFLFLHFAYFDALYVACPSPIIAVLPCLLSSFSLSYVFRRSIYKTFFRKKAQNLLSFDSIINGKWVNRFFLVLTDIIVVVSTLLIMFTVNCNLTFRENGFADKSDILSISGPLISYDEVEAVYHVNARINDFGNRVEGQSYVIVLKDGTGYDLFNYTSVDITREEILPILERENIEIKNIDVLPEKISVQS
ncbi:MAG: hypothetical protein GX824_00980 [Clostridiales bacterium]|nr:hypothetical protein [Clostridiales bacterium]